MMLELNLEHIFRSPAGSKENTSISGAVSLPPELSSEKGKVVTKVTLERTDEGLIINFESKSESRLRCDRCLSNFTFTKRSDIDLYLTNSQIQHLKHFKYDLSSLIQENVLLGIPIKKLCRKNCLGICLKCGQGLNQKKCDCHKIVSINNPFKIITQGKDGSTKKENLKIKNR